MPKYLSKYTVTWMFREMYLPAIMVREQGHKDSPLRCEEWRGLVDALLKDKQITGKQAETWKLPSFC